MQKENPLINTTKALKSTMQLQKNIVKSTKNTMHSQKNIVKSTKNTIQPQKNIVKALKSIVQFQTNTPQQTQLDDLLREGLQEQVSQYHVT